MDLTEYTSLTGRENEMITHCAVTSHTQVSSWMVHRCLRSSLDHFSPAEACLHVNVSHPMWPSDWECAWLIRLDTSQQQQQQEEQMTTQWDEKFSEKKFSLSQLVEGRNLSLARHFFSSKCQRERTSLSEATSAQSIDFNCIFIIVLVSQRVASKKLDQTLNLSRALSFRDTISGGIFQSLSLSLPLSIPHWRECVWEQNEILSLAEEARKVSVWPSSRRWVTRPPAFSAGESFVSWEYSANSHWQGEKKKQASGPSVMQVW